MDCEHIRLRTAEMTDFFGLCTHHDLQCSTSCWKCVVFIVSTYFVFS